MLYPFGMGITDRKFSNDKYRYGFNGKEKSDEVYGEGNEYDYGFRIYNPRVGKFLSTDPLTKSYPELTPYQFASNRPIDGLDLDGLEYVKYSSKATSLIIYNDKRDGIMEAEYQAALKSKMNVMIANSVDDANKYLITKSTKYQRIISSGHGGAEGDRVLIAGAGYSPEDIISYKESLKVFSGFLKDKGMIISLACYNTTPNQQYKAFDPKNPENGEQVSINRALTATMIAVVTGKSFFGADSEVRTGNNVFMEGDLKVTNIKPDREYNLHKSTYNNWRLINPDGTAETYKDVKMRADGSIKGAVTTSKFQKFINKAIDYIKRKIK